MGTTTVTLLLILLSSKLTACAGCPGCPTDSEVNKDIVEFVMTELSYGDCHRSNVKVENFKTQVFESR